ncbi:MAG TPA: ankyrin repeat domain-containing protein [Candidatus Ozemobacteraceae bacterium]|nr:ankyrin repeat domain-containing protein [Candidatus Ozemobacteraceae bacterium]
MMVRRGFGRAAVACVVFVALMIGVSTTLFAQDSEASGGAAAQRWFGMIASGRADDVAAMLDDGFDINATMRDMGCGLHCAVENGQNAILELLTSRGADLNVRDGRNLTPLHLAAVKNRAEACRILLDAGCDVDVTGFTSRDGSAESTPLHLAAESGARDVVELLISRGANVNAVNNFHRTPLFWAKKAGKTDVAELLAAHGAVADPSEIPTTPPASGTEETPASR